MDSEPKLSEKIPDPCAVTLSNWGTRRPKARSASSGAPAFDYPEGVRFEVARLSEDSVLTWEPLETSE